MASIPKPIRDWISQFFTERGVPESSSDVNHDETTNRTHEGDDLSPATLEAGGFNFIGEFQTLSDFESAASSGDRGYITDEQQFAYES